MDFRDYKSFWNDKAATPTGARIAVDGSTDERTLRLTGAFSAAQARAALDLKPGDRVFELGCGVGRIGRELAGEVARWHGLDISENMLDVARERLQGIGDAHFDALSGPRLPMLADASQDKGYCVAVFIHMDKEDMVLYLRDVARVLRPGGLFYFDHWNLAHPVGWKRFAMEVDQAARVPAGQRKDVARNQFCVPEELIAYVRGVGLEPLLVIGDSPNAQLVVRKPDGDAGAEADERARLQRAASRIDYGRQWTDYFEAILEAETSGTAPLRLLALLDARPRADATAEMFRAWIGGLWRLRTAQWGPVPPSLSPVADFQE
jgi:SAM-dependent methyltransferase